MNKTLKLLSGVLAAQVLLAGLVLYKRGPGANAGAAESLLRLTDGDFDRVIITEPEKPSVVLAKKDGRWILPGAGEFPVSPDKFKQTFDALLNLKVSWPVGDTASARKRCKVTEETFAKKVVFYKGDKEKKTLFLGTTPEYRKVHFRPSDRDGVYLLEFGYFDLATTPAEWEDKKALYVDRASVVGIQLPSVSLAKKESGFETADLKPGEESDPGEVESLVTRATTLAFSEVAGREVLPEYGLDKPALTLTLQMKDGPSHMFQFGKPKTGSDYYLKSSGMDFVFKVAGATVDNLKYFTHAKLVKMKKAA